MATPVLISPDQRLLGWALNDLTLYGAQPVNGVTIGRASDGAAVAPVPPAHGSAGPPVAPTPQEAAPAVDHGGADTLPASHAPAAAQPVAFHPDHTGEATPSVPAPIGSGSFVDAPVLSPLQAVAAGQAGGPAAAPAEAAPTATAVDTVPPVAPVAVADSLSAPTIATADAVGTTFDAVGATVGAVASTTAEAAAVLADTTASATDALTHSLADVHDAAAALTQPLAEVHDVAAAVTAPVAGLDGLGGTDPGAGIQTLVGMVESADAFDLTPAVATEVAAAPSIVEALAADEAPGALLGDDPHHDTGIDHGVDVGGIHLGV